MRYQCCQNCESYEFLTEAKIHYCFFMGGFILEEERNEYREIVKFPKRKSDCKSYKKQRGLR